MGSTENGSLDDLIDRNSSTRFLNPVDENKMMDIAKNCNNKTSTDFYGIDNIDNIIYDNIKKGHRRNPETFYTHL